MRQQKNLEIPFVVEAAGEERPREAGEGMVQTGKQTGKQTGEQTGEQFGERIWSVSELSRCVGGLLESHLGQVVVEGEVSGFRRAGSGHCYFQLKDRDAVLRVAMFQGVAERTRFRVEDGLRLLVRGDMRVYMRRGEYQLQAVSVSPRGVGELQLAFEQLRRRLSEEGLFAEELKRELPRFPWCVGVVTSGEGAALQDIVKVLGRRFPGMRVVVQPCLVQGEGAGEQLAAAVRSLSERAQELGIEVMIVGRGGGSVEDLWGFNHEGLARAIRASRVPLVSAVGHEIDFTIADLAADRRAATPSAAAEIISPLQDALLGQVLYTQGRLRASMMRLLGHHRQHLRHLRAQTPSPMEVLQYKKRQWQDNLWRLQVLKHTITAAARGRLGRIAAALQVLSPLAILGRGYAIVQNEAGQALLSAEQSVVGEFLKVRLHRGNLDVKVKGILPQQSAADSPQE